MSIIEQNNKIIKVFMIFIICFSSVSLVLTTEPSLNNKYSKVFLTIEFLASSIFLIEYIFRIYKSNKKLKYIFSFMGIIDLLSFLPYYLLFFKISQNYFVLLVQLLRLIKLTRYSSAFNLLAAVLKDEADSLLVSIMLMFIIVIFASVGIYIFEHNVQPKVFGSIPRAMWWAVVTLTTVGYGDVTPVTPQGKIFATIITIAGVGLVSLPAGIIASGFTEQLRLRREKFEFEVEQLLHDDGVLSDEDMKQLEKDRKELGLDKEIAELIIDHIKQRQRNRKK